MDRYNVLAGLIVNPDNNRWTAYKEEEVDNNTGLYYKVEDVEPLQLELVEVKQQNDRLQKRCKELEGENERLKEELRLLKQQAVCPHCGYPNIKTQERIDELEKCGKTCFCCVKCDKLFVLRNDGDGEFTHK